jgi:Flp pilus assembly pilin Flp
MVRRWIRAVLREDEGQDLIEYTLLLAFLALLTVGVMFNVGQGGKALWSDAQTTLDTAAGNSAVPTPANPTGPATSSTGGAGHRDGHDGHHDGHH